jgi:hypothetical protein
VRKVLKLDCREENFREGISGRMRGGLIPEAGDSDGVGCSGGMLFY